MALYDDCCEDGGGGQAMPGGHQADQAHRQTGAPQLSQEMVITTTEPREGLSSSSCHPPSCLLTPAKPSSVMTRGMTGGLGKYKLFSLFRFISLALSFGSLAGILAIVKLTEAQLLTKAA